MCTGCGRFAGRVSVLRAILIVSEGMLWSCERRYPLDCEGNLD